jgi:hypothetical protein
VDLFDEPTKYDYWEENKDYLIKPGAKLPDIYLVPTFRDDTLRTMYKNNMLSGQVLIDYERKLNADK